MELVTEHVEQVLGPDVRARLEHHLAHCEGCAEHLGQVTRTIALLRALPQEEDLSPPARARLLVAFRAWWQDHDSGA